MNPTVANRALMPADLPRVFEVPDAIADWDDQRYFTFLQDHQFGYQGILDQLRESGSQDSPEFQHFREQFQKVELFLARDFNRRYHQG